MNEVKKFANHAGYSDWSPYEVIRAVSDKCLIVRAMEAELDPNFKCEVIPGGFSGHVANSHAQSYTYSSNEAFSEERIRLHKDGRWYGKGKRKFILADAPYKYYDYNF